MEIQITTVAGEWLEMVDCGDEEEGVFLGGDVGEQVGHVDELKTSLSLLNRSRRSFI